MTTENVTAVVVAWNRATILSDTLDALERQTRPLDGLVVVDNASMDATPVVIAAHRGVTRVVRMPVNTGGAGGFAAGIAAALDTGTDLVWIMDDDTVPQPDALERLLEARAGYRGTPAVLACRADWVDGREHPMNRPRARPWLERDQRLHAEEIGTQAVRTCSFVAALLDARAIHEDGLPMADFFLWNDDFEYTGRLLRHRVGLYVPAARVEHRTAAFGNSTADPGDRFVNEVRNKVWTFTRTHSFNALDTASFAAATLARWAALIARSSQRGAMISRLVEGLKEGARPPHPTWRVLRDTPVGAEVMSVESGAGRV